MVLPNLLNLAHTIIPTVQVSYQSFIGNVINDIGFETPQYSESVLIPNASVHAVSNNTYAQLGLDMAKNYKKVLIPADVIDISQNTSNDLILFDNKTWNIISSDDWFNYNGWNRLIVCENKDYGNVQN